MRKEFRVPLTVFAAMMGPIFAVLALLALGVMGRADAQQTNGVTNTAPLPIHGFGSLSASATTSTPLSTLTIGPNSLPWPTVPSLVYVLNQTAGTLYVCPLGGTCSTAGIWVLSGNAYGFFNMSTNATVYAASAGTVQAQW
jgi:hypothetical protein